MFLLLLILVTQLPDTSCLRERNTDQSSVCLTQDQTIGAENARMSPFRFLIVLLHDKSKENELIEQKSCFLGALWPVTVWQDRRESAPSVPPSEQWEERAPLTWLAMLPLLAQNLATPIFCPRLLTCALTRTTTFFSTLLNISILIKVFRFLPLCTDKRLRRRCTLCLTILFG